ncbi:MAG TPA: TonB-dependent receptor [Gemmatimonadaceae bacterium]|nr:TonB-dependent receptor [Gemmatimonadaceae bacterium]
MLAAVVVATIVAPTAARAQLPDTAPGSIAGRVLSTDKNAPVAGAIVSVDGTRLGAEAGADGRFRIDGVPPGTHAVTTRFVGFATAHDTVTVTSGETVHVDVRLEPQAAVLSTVTVIGSQSDLRETRVRMERIPGAVALVPPEEIRATRQANLKDVLEFTPGVYVQPRYGAADESQISVRGSGLRNNFHARGINLLVNGMPYRNADGFTDFESLELLTTESIEVYKGANALRYGGSTLGGAINLSTKTGYTAQPISFYSQGGAFGFLKTQLSSGRTVGNFDYYASYARTKMENFRQWADQRRDRVNLHAGYRLSPTLDARAFYFFAHVQEHLPGALTRDEMAADPEQAATANVNDRWGRTYDLHHVGLQLRAQLTPQQRLEVSPYVQYRDIDHPIFEVINQVSRDYGLEVRYENTAPLAGLRNRFTLGVQPAYENMDNRQFVNEQGRHGALTRNEKDRVFNLGTYAEDALSVTGRLTALLGARYDRSRRTVDDFFLSNGDQSDERTYTPVSPRVGLLYDVPAMGGSLFANASRTVEPPLLLELSSFGNPGGFIDLDAQKAWQYEVGARGRRSGLAWEMSLYDVELRDEILNLNVEPFVGAPFTVPTYRNADRTRHYGLEAGLAWQLPGAVFVRNRADQLHDHLTARLAYTLARYRYVSDSAFDGNDIPGAPPHYVVAELKYDHPANFSVAPRVEWVPASYFVNSDNTVKNDGWATLGVRAEWTIDRAGLTAFVEGRNLFDRHYAGSVQVDNADGRFFEPADGRSLYAGFRWSQ